MTGNKKCTQLFNKIVDLIDNKYKQVWKEMLVTMLGVNPHSVDTEKSDEYEYYYVYYDEDGNVVNKKDFEPDSVDQQTLDTAQVKQKATFWTYYWSH